MTFSLESLSLVKGEEPKREEKPKLSEYIESLKGKLAILFGKPMVGKSTLCAKIARALLDATGKQAYWIAIDLNLRGEFGQKLRRMSGAKWVYVKSPEELIDHLNPYKDWSKYSAIIVDSLTAFQEIVTLDLVRKELSRYAFEEAMSEEGEKRRRKKSLLDVLMDMRINTIMTRLALLVTHCLGVISKYNDLLAIGIAHETATIKGEFLGLEVKPTFTERAIKNADVVLYMYTRKGKNKELKRYVKIVENRGEAEHIDLTVEEFLGVGE